MVQNIFRTNIQTESPFVDQEHIHFIQEIRDSSYCYVVSFFDLVGNGTQYYLVSNFFTNIKLNSPLPREHWNLLILCNFDESLEASTRNPCMLLLDSLGNAGPSRYQPVMRK